MAQAFGFTQDDDERIIAMRADGADNSAIARSFGKTIGAIEFRVRYLRRTGQIPPEAPPPITEGERRYRRALRVYFAGLVTGHHAPSATIILSLARAEEADPATCLVLTRAELLDADGRPVPVDGDRSTDPPGVVPSEEVAYALTLVERFRPVSIRLVDVRGRALTMKRVRSMAAQSQLDRIKVRTPKERLRLPTEEEAKSNVRN